MAGIDTEHIALAGAPQHHLDMADPIDAVGGNQANGTPAAIARSIIPTASAGLVAKVVSSGTCAPAMRTGSSVQAFGRYSARSMKAWPWRDT